jgi:hypothetical protein
MSHFFLVIEMIKISNSEIEKFERSLTRMLGIVEKFKRVKLNSKFIENQKNILRILKSHRHDDLKTVEDWRRNGFSIQQNSRVVWAILEIDIVSSELIPGGIDLSKYEYGNNILAYLEGFEASIEGFAIPQINKIFCDVPKHERKKFAWLGDMVASIYKRYSKMSGHPISPVNLQIYKGVLEIQKNLKEKYPHNPHQSSLNVSIKSYLKMKNLDLAKKGIDQLSWDENKIKSIDSSIGTQLKNGNLKP